MARWVAADLYAREIEALRAELSIGLRERRAARRWSATRRAVPRAAARRRARASGRRAQLRRGANRAGARGAMPIGGKAPFLDADDFAAPLVLCHRSLVATGNALIAGGRLTDILRRVAAFGLTLAPLDLRQEAARHAEAVAWIARAWNLGLVPKTLEEERVAMLCARAATRHADARGPAARARHRPTGARRARHVPRSRAALPPESLGAYVITMASRASDVLAVELLQKLAGNPRPQRVVPLFETAADLQAPAPVLDALLVAAVVSRAHRAGSRK